MTDKGCPLRMLLMVENDDAHAGFAQRLNALLSEKRLAIKDLMAMAGVSYEMARRYTKGTAAPRNDKLKAIARGLGCTEAFLAYGSPGQSIDSEKSELLTEGHPEQNAVGSKLVVVDWEDEDHSSEEYYSVPLLDLELSAGSGCHALVEAEKYKLPFRRYTLKKQGVDPASAVIVRSTGTSMEPVLGDGDAVGVDTSKTKVVDGKVYAIRDGDLLRVKILIERPDGGIIVRSYNRDEYPDEVLTKAERQERITVIGRVWWSSKLW